MTNDTNRISTIEQTVMRRVTAAHTLRPLLSNAAFALVLFVLALYGVGREVWVAKVFENAPHADIIAALRFFAYAFLDTRLIVQALCLAVLFAFVWMVRDVLRAITIQTASL
ncbi:MAG TPA: hypothetical protein VHC20_01020 [Candidatus Paceibacterota bacterium]|nr:hypothetical protein [Candidatus Paceibacterota bacterium]